MIMMTFLKTTFGLLLCLPSAYFIMYLFFKLRDEAVKKN